jgi:hypothetical protein
MSALTKLNDLGLNAIALPDGNLKIKGLSRLKSDDRHRIVAFCRQNKTAIITALTQYGLPGECESCLAAGYWDYGPYASMGLICCYTAYFTGKPGKPIPCNKIRTNCPRKNEQ